MEFTLIKMKQRRDNELEEKRIQFQRVIISYILIRYLNGNTI